MVPTISSRNPPGVVLGPAGVVASHPVGEVDVAVRGRLGLRVVAAIATVFGVVLVSGFQLCRYPFWRGFCEVTDCVDEMGSVAEQHRTAAAQCANDVLHFSNPARPDDIFFRMPPERLPSTGVGRWKSTVLLFSHASSIRSASDTLVAIGFSQKIPFAPAFAASTTRSACRWSEGCHGHDVEVFICEHLLMVCVQRNIRPRILPAFLKGV